MGHSIYVSTDPNNVVPIGVPGSGTSIGQLGTLIYNANPFLTPADGSTVNIAPLAQGMDQVVNIRGTTTLAALTLAYANGTQNGQTILLIVQPAVTASTFTGSFAAATPTTLAAGQQILYTWNGTQWA